MCVCPTHTLISYEPQKLQWPQNNLNIRENFNWQSLNFHQANNDLKSEDHLMNIEFGYSTIYLTVFLFKGDSLGWENNFITSLIPL